jgi:hypothetical protein
MDRRARCQCHALAALLLTAGLLVAPGALAGGYLVAPIPELESPPQGELADIDATVRRIRRKILDDFLAARRTDPDAPALRDAHAKHHGCVRARLVVDPHLPEALRSPVFQPGAEYPSWVRFSNAQGRPGGDTRPDARGMAIKLMQVPGPKLLDAVFRDTTWFQHQRETQDLVLINHDRFFVADVAVYRRFTEALASGSGLRLLLFFAAHPRELGIALKMLSKPTFSPLDQHYQSLVPFLFGDGQAAKFSALPVDCRSGAVRQPEPGPDSAPDFLRQALASALDPDDGDAACFDIGAQVRVDTRLSVEDATAGWDTISAPRFSLARLRIPPQRFDSEAQMAFCEGLSFSPWHGIPEHQPLGGLNRSRLHAYKAISELRHWLNQTPASEPVGDEEF